MMSEDQRSTQFTKLIDLNPGSTASIREKIQCPWSGRCSAALGSSVVKLAVCRLGLSGATHARNPDRCDEIPNGDSLMKMNRLIPMLPVKSMPASIEFYQKLGFSVEQRNDEWGCAMMRFYECRLMVDQSIDRHSNALRESVIYL